MRKTLAAALAATMTITTATTSTATTRAPALDWHGCSTGSADEVGRQLDAVGAQCAELQVPLDYAHPARRQITVAIARRLATDRPHRQGTLVVNVGGPEASRQGVNVFLEASPKVAATYDLVGIDPRFFGRSTPLECDWPTNRYLNLVQFGTPDRASFEHSVSLAKDLAGRCAPYAEVLPFASTRNIARDLDRVREALGERRISFLGWSYGTYLGAVYLQLFPGNSDRFVLDSSHGPDSYGPRWTRETASADAGALADWAAWVARRNSEYGLGTTKARVLAAVDHIARVAKRRPLAVGTHRVDAAMLPGLLLTVADTDELYGEFSAQVRVLRDAADGLVVTPTATQDERFGLYELGEVIPEFGFSATNANQCADRAAPRDPEVYYRDIRAHLATEPLYGPLARHITPCAFWPTSPVEQPTVIDNNRPALIVSATGDPATPYPGQLAMHQALKGSRQLTVTGAYRHGVFPYSPCVDDTVNRYLGEGALPAGDLSCRGQR
ncbi:alpha/beta fold hydrolase [Kribbella sp. NPDC051620]|uniref:alpha/beta fold hydrolase n=1 Tax=Kribbella sp. NPDC051620 TaxID=3364120 RepID=UPI0037ACB63A